jgi:PIN domain nuclease of toxin-antitoxin system
MKVLIDTHVAAWFLWAPERLPDKVRRLLGNKTDEGYKVGVASISLFELVYLVEKRRLESVVLERVLDAISQPDGPFEEVPLIAEMASSLQDIPAVTVPDMPDRIIAATARYRGVPLVSKNARIRQLNPSILQVIW